jgi:hypothetical protein
MLNSRPGTPSTITRYLETLKHNVPHRPGGHRAQRFIDLVPAIEAAFVRMAPMEAVELLSAATQAVAAIIGTGLLNHDDHAEGRKMPVVATISSTGLAHGTPCARQIIGS